MSAIRSTGWAALLALAAVSSSACLGPSGHEADQAPLRMGTPVAVAAAQSPVMSEGDTSSRVRPPVKDRAADPLRAPDDVAAPPADATFTSSGLATRVLRAGDGAYYPDPTSRVRVHYTGWTTDGQMFDSSVERGRPTTFPLNAVIPGFQEGVGLMVEGEVRRLWIPANLAYQGRPGAPQGMLVFDVELLGIEAASSAAHPAHGAHPTHGATP